MLQFTRQRKEMIHNILYKLYWRLTVNEWQIGFPQTTLENIATGGDYKIAMLKGAPKGRWFADPFVLDVTPTHIILLVEEFVSASAKGRIARLTVSRKDYTLERNDTLLDLDTHLSFPTIVRQEDAVLSSQKIRREENCTPTGTMKRRPNVCRTRHCATNR